MTVCGIIAEYNPLHRGHLLPAEAARTAGATHIVAVMSGNFVQRGEPALCPWQYRVTAALQSGIDLVLQLPLPYAAATAEHFAVGGVSALDALGCVDSLIFGSECGEIAPLSAVAGVLDSPTFSAAVTEGLQKGLPFAAARQDAVASLLGTEAAAVLSSPNNTLGVEYLRALARLESPIRPMTLLRQGAAHDSDTEDAAYCSATLLRQKVRQGEDVARWVPPAMKEQLAAAIADGALPDRDLWQKVLLTHLRGMTEEAFAALPDVSEGLEHRLYRAARTARSTEELLGAVKTRRYSHARLRRILLAAYLGIPAGMSASPLPYLRVLGMTPKGAEILSAAKDARRLPLSASLTELSAHSPEAAAMAALEARAADLYHAVTPGLAPCGTEYTQPFIKVGF